VAVEGTVPSGAFVGLSMSGISGISGAPLALWAA
jgi:hypothetical protein